MNLFAIIDLPPPLCYSSTTLSYSQSSTSLRRFAIPPQHSAIRNHRPPSAALLFLHNTQLFAIIDLPPPLCYSSTTLSYSQLSTSLHNTKLFTTAALLFLHNTQLFAIIDLPPPLCSSSTTLSYSQLSTSLHNTQLFTTAALLFLHNTQLFTIIDLPPPLCYSSTTLSYSQLSTSLHNTQLFTTAALLFLHNTQLFTIIDLPPPLCYSSTTLSYSQSSTSLRRFAIPPQHSAIHNHRPPSAALLFLHNTQLFTTFDLPPQRSAIHNRRFAIPPQHSAIRNHRPPSAALLFLHNTQLFAIIDLPPPLCYSSTTLSYSQSSTSLRRFAIPPQHSAIHNHRPPSAALLFLHNTQLFTIIDLPPPLCYSSTTLSYSQSSTSLRRFAIPPQHSAIHNHRPPSAALLFLHNTQLFTTFDLPPQRSAIHNRRFAIPPQHSAIRNHRPPSAALLFLHNTQLFAIIDLPPPLRYSSTTLSYSQSSTSLRRFAIPPQHSAIHNHRPPSAALLFLHNTQLFAIIDLPPPLCYSSTTLSYSQSSTSLRRFAIPPQHSAIRNHRPPSAALLFLHNTQLFTTFDLPPPLCYSSTTLSYSQSSTSLRRFAIPPQHSAIHNFRPPSTTLSYSQPPLCYSSTTLSYSQSSTSLRRFPIPPQHAAIHNYRPPSAASLFLHNTQLFTTIDLPPPPCYLQLSTSRRRYSSTTLSYLQLSTSLRRFAIYNYRPPSAALLFTTIDLPPPLFLHNTQLSTTIDLPPPLCYLQLSTSLRRLAIYNYRPPAAAIPPQHSAIYNYRPPSAALLFTTIDLPPPPCYLQLSTSRRRYSSTTLSYLQLSTSLRRLAIYNYRPPSAALLFTTIDLPPPLFLHNTQLFTTIDLPPPPCYLQLSTPRRRYSSTILSYLQLSTSLRRFVSSSSPIGNSNCSLYTFYSRIYTLQLISTNFSFNNLINISHPSTPQLHSVAMGV
ncbi:hypothetical protein BZA77DRAFT_360840 [Pyronema omphalodes]|nr:hypothetical protein BZA77DRAFT_360840 [Pyronema omphalodes]